MTQTQLLAPHASPQTAIIRDLIIGKQYDLCTQEACPSIRLLIDLPHESKVIKLDQTSLKNLKAVYREKLSGWIGKKLTVYSSKNQTGVSVLPII